MVILGSFSKIFTIFLACPQTTYYLYINKHKLNAKIMKAIMVTSEQFSAISQYFKDCNVKLIRKPEKGSLQTYYLKFPSLTGGIDQLKKEKALKQKIESLNIICL